MLLKWASAERAAIVLMVSDTAECVTRSIEFRRSNTKSKTWRMWLEAHRFPCGGPVPCPNTCPYPGQALSRSPVAALLTGAADAVQPYSIVRRFDSPLPDLLREERGFCEWVCRFCDDFSVAKWQRF